MKDNKKNKFRVLLMGKLGNQLFQYAFAIAHAKTLDCTYEVVMTNSEPNIARQYFTIDSDRKKEWFYHMEFIRERTKKKILGEERYYKRIGANKFDTSTAPQVVLANSNKTGTYQGFFQSDLYFLNHATIIKKEFKIKQVYQDLFLDKYSELFDNHKVVVVHIRAKDYLTHGNDELGGKSLVLPISYYHNCLKKINQERHKVVFVSDDIPYCKEKFGTQDNYIYSEEDMITDFQLIQHADIKIISNSTFSWWAAYLNKKAMAITYGPKNWLGFRVNKEYPIGIMTPIFKWVTV